MSCSVCCLPHGCFGSADVMQSQQVVCCLISAFLQSLQLSRHHPTSPTAWLRYTKQHPVSWCNACQGVNTVAAVPNKPLILLKDDSSSGPLPAQAGGGSLQGEGWAVAAETWLLQDMCDEGQSSCKAGNSMHSSAACQGAWWFALWLHGQHCTLINTGCFMTICGQCQH